MERKHEGWKGKVRAAVSASYKADIRQVQRSYGTGIIRSLTARTRTYYENALGPRNRASSEHNTVARVIGRARRESEIAIMAASRSSSKTHAITELRRFPQGRFMRLPCSLPLRLGELGPKSTLPLRQRRVLIIKPRRGDVHWP